MEEPNVAVFLAEAAYGIIAVGGLIAVVWGLNRSFLVDDTF